MGGGGRADQKDLCLLLSVRFFHNHLHNIEEDEATSKIVIFKQRDGER